jgi:hypothetical protein
MLVQTPEDSSNGVSSKNLLEDEGGGGRCDENEGEFFLKQSKGRRTSEGFVFQQKMIL